MSAAGDTSVGTAVLLAVAPGVMLVAALGAKVAGVVGE